MDPTVKPALEPTVIVIFGITGDLSQRYLLPSLYHLFQEHLLHEDTRILGLTRQSITAQDLFARAKLSNDEETNSIDAETVERLHASTEIMQFDPAVLDDYHKLLERLNDIESVQGVCMNRLYYLSIPPKVFNTTVEYLGAAGLNKSCQHDHAKTRVLVEKPFGYDLASAEALIEHTAAVFDEEQVFRIDHYLAKETVQNILTFRSKNPVFASVWNHEHVQRIDILASEKIGIEGRVGFYEGVGATRDLIQSHLLQLLAVTTMDLPADITDSESIHTAKQALLEAIKPVDPAQAVRGQYDSYTTEVENPQSTTETYARLHLDIDSERWRGVPITIATGKALAERHTDVTITFTDPSRSSEAINELTFRIQPNEGIHVKLRVKKPSFQHELADAVMDFSYQQAFGVSSNHPSAYERVLVDAVKGDRTLFATSGEVLASWHIIEPVIAAWRDNRDYMAVYASGSTGPA